MQRRTIGGIETSPVGLGTARMASLGARRSKRDAARLLDAAADLGVTFIDTADTYGSTACERRLGDLTGGRRADRFVIATKSGLTTVDLPGPLRALNQPGKKLLQRSGHTQRLGPAHLRRSIDASLARLRRERLDLYFLHSPPVGVEAREDLFAVLDEARAAGKIGAFGVSSSDPAIVDAVVRARGCPVAQAMVNPLTTAAVRAVQGVDLIANHVLMGPVLMAPDPPAGAPPGAAELARRLDAVAAERGASRATLLIRHAAAVPNVKVVLVGTASPAHLAEAVSALVRPSSEDDLLA